MLLGMDSPGSGAVGFLGEKKASPGPLECAMVGLGTWHLDKAHQGRVLTARGGGI